jgi:hypothetical protein
MAIAKKKNGVPILNKSGASGHTFLPNRRQRFNVVDWDYAEFTLDTNLGTPDPTIYFEWRYGGSAAPDSLEVAWGDGSYETYTSASVGGNYDYTYASNGTYTVRWNNLLPPAVQSGGLFRAQSGQVNLWEKATDVTRWGWALRTPNWVASSGVASWIGATSISASDSPGSYNSKGVKASGNTTTVVDMGLQNWATEKFTWKASGSVFYQNYNVTQDMTGIVPDLSNASRTFEWAQNYNTNINGWEESLETLNPQADKTALFGSFFRAFNFNNGDAVGVSGGGVNIGWDRWKVGGEKAQGNPTTLSTGKLIDSSASFVTDGIVVGYRVYKRYGRVYTTVASVDSETQLTLNDDIFSSLSDYYVVANEDQNYFLKTMMGSINSFNQYIGSWNTLGKTELYQCLGGGFNQDISSWDVTYNTTFFQFTGAAFNFGSPAGVANTAAQAWDDRVYQVTDFIQFSTGYAFNSDVSGWRFGYPNDTIQSTNTSDAEAKLIDSTATFITNGVTTSWRVTNMDTGKQAKVSSVDSETELTLSTDIFVGSTGQNYEVFFGVIISSWNLGGVTYDLSVWDTRCIWGSSTPMGNGTRSATFDTGQWNMRNNTTVASFFTASGGSVASMANQDLRNWMRGAIGDADYSTTRCITLMNNFYYHAEVQQNFPMENWDTRNVTSWGTFNQNGRWKQSPAEWCLASCTNLVDAFGLVPLRLCAIALSSWVYHPLGCNTGVNGALQFNNRTNTGSFRKTKQLSTVSSGTTTGVGASVYDVVIDSSATFVTDGVAIADTVNNLTTGQHVYVISVDSETQLTVSQQYFSTVGDSYNVQTDYDGQEAYGGWLKSIAPSVFDVQATGTNTSVVSLKLVDSGASFLTTAAVGDTVKNTTTGLSTKVVRVVSDTELRLNDNRFTSTPQNYSVERFNNSVKATGTTTSTASLKLVDSGASFLTTVSEGDRVKNTTDNTYSYVVSVDSDTQLSIYDEIFVSGEGYQVEGGFGWTTTGTQFLITAGVNQSSDSTKVTKNPVVSPDDFTVYVTPGLSISFSGGGSTTVASVTNANELVLTSPVSAFNQQFYIDYTF